jgi:hypothetical protein
MFILVYLGRDPHAWLMLTLGFRKIGGSRDWVSLLACVSLFQYVPRIRMRHFSESEGMVSHHWVWNLTEVLFRPRSTDRSSGSKKYPELNPRDYNIGSCASRISGVHHPYHFTTLLNHTPKKGAVETRPIDDPTERLGSLCTPLYRIRDSHRDFALLRMT